MNNNVSISDLKNNIVEGAVSGEPIYNPNLINNISTETEQRVVSPEELGFKAAPEKEEKSDIIDALKLADEIIDKKIEEVNHFNDLVDQTDGNLSEYELRQELKQDYVTKELNDVSEDDVVDPYEKEYASLSLDKSDEEDDDFDYEYDASESFNQPVETNKVQPITSNVNIPEVPKVTPIKSVEIKDPTSELPSNIKDLAFPDDEFGDDDLDDEDEKTDEQKDEDIQLQMLKAEVKEKIKPVAKVYDLQSFVIAKKPVSLTSTLNKVNGPQMHVANWVLYSSERPIVMRGFTGNELEKLNNPGGTNNLNRERARYNMIYEHIIDPNKPSNMDDWAKCTSFLDIENLWMAVYRSCFDGTNFIPYNCPNTKCDNKAFLSDNTPIMDMVKFKNENAKIKFNEILNKDSDYSHKFYTTECVQVSDNYAFTFKEPSIYEMIFELAMLDDKFVEKYRELLTIITYIDDIYFIDYENQTLSPVGYKSFINNHMKTVKAKISQYSKVIRTLSSDQYNAILQYINKISEPSDDIKYQLPEVTCKVCGTVIPAQEATASSLVFTRHQLTTLAAL